MSFLENREGVEHLKAACGLCAAKTGQSREEGFLPLWMHLLDTAGVMEKLFDLRIPLMIQNHLIRKCGSKERARGLFILTGLVHDIGKASSVFQEKIFHSGEIPFEFPLRFLNREEYGDPLLAHHSRLGMVILMKEGFHQAFASVTGAHHGRTHDRVKKKDAGRITARELAPLYGPLEDEDYWNRVWEQMCRACLDLAGFETAQDVPELEKPELMVLAGYLSHADWAASALEYFPLITRPEEAVTARYPRRVEQGWERLNLPERWTGRGERSFTDLFGFEPHPFQQKLEEIVKNAGNPGLVIVEAPMGLGKTEAALMLADQLAARTGAGGVFMGLPTQATANGLLSRFEDWTYREAGGNTVVFRLAHGGASLNQEYARLARTASCISEETADDGLSQSLVVHHWMDRSQLALFSDFVLGTVDQALMAGLDHRYVALRHAGLAAKVLIIDEVHSYDAYMLEYFSTLLSWMGAYHAPVILLSATLPRTTRKELTNAYLKGMGVGKKSLNLRQYPEDDTYPCVTWTSGDQAFFSALPASGKKTQVKLVQKVFQDSEQENRIVMEALQEKLQEGGCAGVVVNSIRKAQELYEILKMNSSWDVVLIHSGFTGVDRRIKEEQILQRAGRHSSEGERAGFVVIGTQVIEQSLDLDFDFMISELAPMDLLLQRVGRLHRHAGRKRPGLLAEPELVVLQPRSIPDENWHSVYSDWILYRTLQDLPKSVTLPDDIPGLVNAVYGPVEKEGLSAEENRLFEQDEILRSRKKSKADGHVLKGPERLLSNPGLNGLQENSSIRTYSTAENSVRDIEPSLEAVLLKQGERGLESPDLKPLQNIRDVRELLARKVRIPRISKLSEAEDEVRKRMAVSEGDIGILLDGELFIVLDENGRFELQNGRYEYSSETGIRKIE